VEAKYLYNFRYFNNLSHEDLKLMARLFDVSYTHPYLNRRQLAKRMAEVFYQNGVNLKPLEVME
jgi:hypothetical protein